MLLLICGIWKLYKLNIYQYKTHRKHGPTDLQAYDYQIGKGWEKDKLGVWDYYTHYYIKW